MRRRTPFRRLAFWLRGRQVLGINARNLHYVHGLNPRHCFPMADDKIRAKEILAAAGVPVPVTLAVLGNLAEVRAARGMLASAGQFAVKPARGRQGTGIVVVTGVEGDRYRSAGGELFSWDDLRSAMGDILFGAHSFGRQDRVLVEDRIQGHAALGDLGTAGLPDIRVILLRGVPVMAMMRVPTVTSRGRANLHQGAIGIAVRLRDGAATGAVMRGSPMERHPDTGAPLGGFMVPLWEEVIDTARRAAAAFPLPYLGVDVVVADPVGPLVMEVNARPGLEIQNVNGRGLRRRLERLTAAPSRSGP